MAVRSRRGRKTGRFEWGQYYAILLDEVLRSEAFRELPHFARSVFCVMAAQYRGANNGDISMTAKMAREYGIAARELAAAIPLLEVAGLIVRTRQGRFAGGKALCSLWALTCWPIDPSDKYDLPRILQAPAPHDWARWKRPDNWADVVRHSKQKAKGRKSPSPPRGERAAPHVGSGESEINSSRGEQGLENSAPHVGDASYDLGRGLHSRVRQFMDLHPHMSDVDVAVAFKWRVNQFDVSRIRQGRTDPGNGS